MTRFFRTCQGIVFGDYLEKDKTVTGVRHVWSQQHRLRGWKHKIYEVKVPTCSISQYSVE